MVFGWGKKKSQDNQEEHELQNNTITLTDVLKIVTDFCKLRESQTLSMVKNLRDQTSSLIDDLIKIGDVLEKDNLNVDDIDKHLAIIVVRGKNQVIDVIKKDVKPLPKITSMDDAKKLDIALNQILKKIGDVLGRQTRVIHIFAKKYAAQLKDNLEVMNANRSEIHKILNNFDTTTLVSEEILNALNQIENLKNDRIECSKKIIETKTSIESLTEKISLLEKSIGQIKCSDAYKSYLDLKNELNLFFAKKSEIKNEIDSQFTKISRPLSRYEYTSSLDKDQKNILSKLVEEPFDVLLPSNKDSIIVILENIRKGIVSGAISVKDIDKTSLQITETEECLDAFVNRVSEFFEKYAMMKNKMNSLRPTDLDSLENELTKNMSIKDDLEIKSRIIQEEIGDTDSKIPQLVSEIEEKLKKFSNTSYTVLQS
ncbi:MAG: exonuclease SbcC [Nitrosopumilus sp.]|nr:exonuclease SbcC [Nitrosopumilus sp.]MDH5658923.1 exonuclease SbcC [Nitrosopumilus sp.]